MFDLSRTGTVPHSTEDVWSPRVSSSGLQHILGAVETGEEDEVLLLHAEDVLLQSVQHQDPEGGEGQEDPSKDTAEYVEDHEGSESGHVDVLHGVQPEGADTDEGEAAVNLLAGEGVPRVQGEDEEPHEEEEGGDPEDDL